MLKGQKQSVIEQVFVEIPTFRKNIDNAMSMLSPSQLENIKNNIKDGIAKGLIEYSKDCTNHSEVRSYARSMTMNHLKKAKELNGGDAYAPAHHATADIIVKTKQKTNKKLAPKGVDPDLLTEELREYVKNLV